MAIGFLGAGSWGFCLASILAAKGYGVISWTTKPQLADELNRTHAHPFFPGHQSTGDLHFTTDMDEVFRDAELLVEAVTSAGLRSVLEKVKSVGTPSCPLVITSKGIE